MTDILIVGAGPAGLTAAVYACRAGMQVTVFDKSIYGGQAAVTKDIENFPAIENINGADFSHRLYKQALKAGADIRFEEVRSLKLSESIKTAETSSGSYQARAVILAHGVRRRHLECPGEKEFFGKGVSYCATCDGYFYKNKDVAVVGGGNVAMDAVRTAARLGAEAHIVYRRSEAELPARAEEVHHAKQEGIEFRMLTNPVEVLGDEKGWVRGLRCVRMELGEPDASGRRSPVAVEGSEFEIGCDVVIMALGTSPNPLIASTTRGLETNRRGCLVADEVHGQTSREGIFAGGDAVTGAATVILAMGAGRRAARAIDEYVRAKSGMN